MTIIEHCIDCDKETKNHCRMCGLPLCSNCARLNNGIYPGNNICRSCEQFIDENIDEDIEDEFRRTS